LDGKWQCVPAVKQNGKTNPKPVIVNGDGSVLRAAPSIWIWSEDGKRRTRPVGTTPREALDAWLLQSSIRTGLIETDEEHRCQPKTDGIQ
jgi:hypothetical protein